MAYIPNKEIENVGRIGHVRSIMKRWNSRIAPILVSFNKMRASFWRERSDWLEISYEKRPPASTEFKYVLNILSSILNILRVQMIDNLIQ